MTNQEKWIDFCLKHDGEICLFNKPFWLDAVCDGRENWDVFLVEENGTLKAALPFYRKKRLGLEYITMPLLTPHSEIWMKTVENERPEMRISREYEMYQLLIEQIEASGASLYQQSFSPGVKNWQPFYWKGYKQKTLYTFSINRPYNLAEAEKRFSKSTRKNIRKASLSGTISEFDNIALFYTLNCMTFARKNEPNPITRPLLERVYKACKENDALKMLYAKDLEGNICDALLLVYDAMNVYSLMCGSVPDTRHYNFLTALDYEGIKFACETGRNYDFEGSMIEGVANYNVKFGTEMYPYYFIRKVLVNKPILSQYLKYKAYA